MHDNRIENFNWLEHFQSSKIISELNLALNILNNPLILKKFTNLKVLNLFKCEKIMNISFLKWDNFANLEKLNLVENDIRDATPIKYLKKLKILKLNHNFIKEINFFDEKNSIIEELYLARNYIKDISPLLNLKYLDIVNIDSQNIKEEFRRYSEGRCIRELYEKLKKDFEMKVKLIKNKVRICIYKELLFNNNRI